MNTGRILRVLAAIAMLISGIVHLDLYFNFQYRFAGDAPNFGRSLILNVVASGIIAAALVARTDWFIRAAGMGFAASTIAVFAYTHSGNAFLGFSAEGLEPSPQSQVALVVQIAAIVLLAATFLPAVAGDDAPLALPALAVAAAVAAVALIGLTVRWQPDDAAAAAAAPAQAVTIQNFAFNGSLITIPKGTTVTWTNADTAPHSVVAEDTSFVSDNLAKGATFQRTFDTDGTFAYFCGIHTYMHGTITVTG
jgi:plastocyanin